MSEYRMKICNKLEKELKQYEGKEIKVSSLEEIIRKIVNIEKEFKRYQKMFGESDFLMAFAPSINSYRIDILLEEDEFIRIEYYFGEDDNQVFVDCSIVEDDELLEEIIVKIKYVWT